MFMISLSDSLLQIARIKQHDVDLNASLINQDPFTLAF